MSMSAKVLAGVVGLVIVAAIAVGGWNLGWWAKNSAVNHQAHIFQNSYGTQSAYIEQAQSALVSIDSLNAQIASPQTPATEQAALQSQKQAVVNQTCGVIDQITITVPRSIASFASSNC